MENELLTEITKNKKIVNKLKKQLDIAESKLKIETNKLVSSQNKFQELIGLGSKKITLFKYKKLTESQKVVLMLTTIIAICVAASYIIGTAVIFLFIVLMVLACMWNIK